MRIKIYFTLLAVLMVGFTACKKESGCTDPKACNFNPNAVEEDGSCVMPTTWYPDNDGDGFADSHHSITDCSQPVGYVEHFYNTSGGGGGTATGGGGGSLAVQQVQRAVLPYVGATWCPPCGANGEETKNHIDDTWTKDQAIVISSQSGDAISPDSGPMCEAFGNEFMSAYSQNGIPHMFVSGGGVEDHFYPSPGAADGFITQITGLDPTVGVAVIGSSDGSEITVTAKAEFYGASSTEHHMSILILEDEVIADQSVSGQGTVADMPHNHIIRGSADESNIRGVSLGASFTDGQEVTKTFTIPVGSAWGENLRVIALVWEGSELNISNGCSSNVE